MTPPEQSQLPLSSKSRGSFEEVVAFCLSLGLEKRDGEYFFYKWEENGWKNNRQPIKDWQRVVRTWRAAGYCPSQKLQGRQVASAKPNPNTMVVAHQKELDRVLERMKSIKSTYDHHQSWRADDLVEWKALKARKAELKSLLGVVF